jgi:hypothetical protein
MAEGVELVGQTANEIYNHLISFLPEGVQNFISFFLLVIVIVIYSVFIWKFYKFVSKKNIFSLDLHQYNKSEHPLLARILGTFLYILEYIIILPIFIFFWFGIFAIFLTFLTEDLSVQSILLISAVVVGAVRMVSYYKEDLAKEIAKLLPFTLLAVSMTRADFFDFQRVLSNITQLPSFFGNILNYLIFIIILEIILRSFDLLFSRLEINEDEEELTE